METHPSRVWIENQERKTHRSHHISCRRIYLHDRGKVGIPSLFPTKTAVPMRRSDQRTSITVCRCCISDVNLAGRTQTAWRITWPSDQFKATPEPGPGPAAISSRASHGAARGGALAELTPNTCPERALAWDEEAITETRSSLPPPPGKRLSHLSSLQPFPHRLSFPTSHRDGRRKAARHPHWHGAPVKTLQEKIPRCSGPVAPALKAWSTSPLWRNTRPMGQVSV